MPSKLSKSKRSNRPNTARYASKQVDHGSSAVVQMNNWREQVTLERTLNTLDRSSRSLSTVITIEQKATNRRFRRKVQQTRLAYARTTGDRDSARELRARTTGLLNTNVGETSDADMEVLRQVWRAGRRQRWQMEVEAEREARQKASAWLLGSESNDLNSEQNRKNNEDSFDNDDVFDNDTFNSPLAITISSRLVASSSDKANRTEAVPNDELLHIAKGYPQLKQQGDTDKFLLQRNIKDGSKSPSCVNNRGNKSASSIQLRKSTQDIIDANDNSVLKLNSMSITAIDTGRKSVTFANDVNNVKSLPVNDPQQFNGQQAEPPLHDPTYFNGINNVKTRHNAGSAESHGSDREIRSVLSHPYKSSKETKQLSKTANANDTTQLNDTTRSTQLNDITLSHEDPSGMINSRQLSNNKVSDISQPNKVSQSPLQSLSSYKQTDFTTINMPSISKNADVDVHYIALTKGPYDEEEDVARSNIEENNFVVSADHNSKRPVTAPIGFDNSSARSRRSSSLSERRNSARRRSSVHPSINLPLSADRRSRPSQADIRRAHEYQSELHRKRLTMFYASIEPLKNTMPTERDYYYRAVDESARQSRLSTRSDQHGSGGALVLLDDYNPREVGNLSVRNLTSRDVTLHLLSDSTDED